MRRATLSRAATLGVVAFSVAAVLAAPSALAEEPEPSPTPTSTSAPTPAPTPTRRATSTPTPSAPTASPSGPSTHVEPDHEAIDAAVLASQIAEASRITAALNSSNSQVAAATQAMDRLADRSNALLESLATARDVEAAATQEATTARADLVLLEARLERARAIVRDWVFSVYSGGGGESDIAGMLDAMLADPDDIGDPLGDLSYLTEQRTRALQDVRVLTAEQVRLSAAADAAEKRASEARAKIEKDKVSLDAALLDQREKVTGLRQLQISEVQKAGPVAGMLVGARSAEARAAAARLRDALSAATFDVTNIGKPCTDDSTVYPNGMIPTSGLCPVWGAPGERLSPDAAAAFSALSKAYAAQTGTAAVHHRLLPLVLRAGLGQGHPWPVRGHPRHEPARPGPRRRPLRRRAALRLGRPPLDDRQRAALRLVPPLVGRRRGLAPGAVALRVRRLTEPPRHRDTRP